MKNTPSSANDVRTFVRQRYSQFAAKIAVGEPDSCCGSGATTASSCCGGGADAVKIGEAISLYDAAQHVDALPDVVTDMSLGCGDPVTLAALEPGQTVVDLGSGGGIDCFLAAKQVGSTGRVIGVDMTPAMLEQARANLQQMRFDNVEFRLGEIEHLPLENGMGDVIISNCVINLSPDKSQVFSEAFRALKPGGKFSVSDIVTQGPLPAAVKNSLSAWAGCVSGALEVDEYTAGLEAAGFTDITVKPVYLSPEMIDEALNEMPALALDGISPDDVYRAVFSAKITAFKPA